MINLKKTVWILLVLSEICIPLQAARLGVLFYSGRSGDQEVYLLKPGEREPLNLTRHPANDLCPAASPDGRRIAFLSDRSGVQEIYAMDADGGGVKRLTFSPEKKEHPEYSPDGRRIVFVKDLASRSEIWIMDADGKGARRLTSNNCRDERPFVSADSRRILFMSDRGGNYDIYAMAMDGSGQVPLTQTPEHEIFPTWSPDGREIAYARKSMAGGRMQGMIRVMNADGTNDRALTGAETRDENPMWSPDGAAIVFQSLRDGNFEVYRMDRDGDSPQRLTSHPAWDGWASFIRCSGGEETKEARRCEGMPMRCAKEVTHEIRQSDPFHHLDPAGSLGLKRDARTAAAGGPAGSGAVTFGLAGND